MASFFFWRSWAGSRVRSFVRGEPELCTRGMLVSPSVILFFFGKAPKRQLYTVLNSIPIAVSGSGRTRTSSLDTVIPCPSPPRTRFLVGCSSPVMRLAQHLSALRAWCKQCPPGRWKPNVLRPGIVGMRRSMVIRLRPCTTWVHPGLPPMEPIAWSLETRRAPSRLCRDARVYFHLTYHHA